MAQVLFLPARSIGASAYSGVKKVEGVVVLDEISLTCLKKGESAVLMRIDAPLKLRRRLTELGFTDGTTVTCVQIAPAGSPIAVWVRGAVIALRQSLCDKIRCCRLPSCVLEQDNDI